MLRWCNQFANLIFGETETQTIRTQKPKNPIVTKSISKDIILHASAFYKKTVPLKNIASSGKYIEIET